MVNKPHNIACPIKNYYWKSPIVGSIIQAAWSIGFTGVRDSSIKRTCINLLDKTGTSWMFKCICWIYSEGNIATIFEMNPPNYMPTNSIKKYHTICHMHRRIRRYRKWVSFCFFFAGNWKSPLGKTKARIWDIFTLIHAGAFTPVRYTSGRIFHKKVSGLPNSFHLAAFAWLISNFSKTVEEHRTENNNPIHFDLQFSQQA